MHPSMRSSSCGARPAGFGVSRNGYEHLGELRDTNTGAILLGAHLGSFYAMRVQGAEEALSLYPVVFTKHARRINDVLEGARSGGQRRGSSRWARARTRWTSC